MSRVTCRLAGVVSLSLLGLVTGCGSSPPSTFFALSPAPASSASPGQTSAQPGAPRIVRLRRPSIPGYLDRPQIVRRVVDYRLGVAANERWGGPLDEMIGRVLAQDLEARLSGAAVFTEDGAITVDPDATVEVNVLRFELGANDEVLLAAGVAVTREGTAPATRSVRLAARPATATTPSLVATMSDLLAQLADAVVALLQ